MTDCVDSSDLPCDSGPIVVSEHAHWFIPTPSFLIFPLIVRLQVWYCSAECQKKDWKNGHKAECKAMKEGTHNPWAPRPATSPKKDQEFWERMAILTRTRAVKRGWKGKDRYADLRARAAGDASSIITKEAVRDIERMARKGLGMSEGLFPFASANEAMRLDKETAALPDEVRAKILRLHELVKEGGADPGEATVDEIKAILSSGPPRLTEALANGRGAYAYPVLIFALQSGGNEAVVTALLEAGAKPELNSPMETDTGWDVARQLCPHIVPLLDKYAEEPVVQPVANEEDVPVMCNLILYTQELAKERDELPGASFASLLPCNNSPNHALVQVKYFRAMS